MQLVINVLPFGGTSSYPSLFVVHGVQAEVGTVTLSVSRALLTNSFSLEDQDIYFPVALE